MGKFSRVKKNEQLYQEIVAEDKTSIIESSLRDYERRIAKNDEESKYIASRLKKNKTIDVESEIEEVSQQESKKLSKEDILRDRDLLADFIEEVKHYNINRGLRSVADTQMNILETLHKSEPEEKTLEAEAELDLTSEIQQVISDLDVDNLDLDQEDEVKINETTFKPLNENKDKQLIDVFQEIETSALDVVEEVVDKEVSDTAKIVYQEGANKESDYKSNELLELTQTLNLKLDLNEEESEATLTSTKANFLDRLLTFFIAILVVALLVMIGVGIWWVYKERGL